MSCVQTLTDYGLRSIGIGERMLPRGNFTLCEQFTLIGSGLIWNVYFAWWRWPLGFSSPTALAMGKASANPWLQKPARWFIFVFPRLAAVYPILLLDISCFRTEKRICLHGPVHSRMAWGAGGAVFQHLRL